jgi:GR25 family glycosyltransferase involved in LPS biosynthesis
MSVLGCFDHAFVLNLPEDAQRMEETQQELSRHKIPFERLAGSTMVGLPKNKYLGNLGCLRSHLSAVRIARERGYKNVLIMEDDVVLRPSFRELWEDVIPQLGGLDSILFILQNFYELLLGSV